MGIRDAPCCGAGRFESITRYADLAGTMLVASSLYTYDNAGRLTSLRHEQGQTVFAEYVWTFDDLGRIISFVSPDGTSTYTYDSTGQLTEAEHSYQADEQYEYDANGNRIMGAYVVGPNNQILSDGTYDYEYDAEGNRTKRTEIATGEYVEYEWDHRNRLRRVTFRDAQGQVTKQVEYDYDLFDRRIARRVDEDGDGVFDRGERFVYDIGVKGGLDDVVLVFDNSGSLKTRYLHGPAVDQPLAAEDDLLELVWTLADHQGTIRSLLEYDPLLGESSLVNHITYDAFGNITGVTNPSADFLYAYTGREWDPDAELYYHRARWYDPQLGRWISEDPIGFAAGDSNLLRYVHNSPTILSDPTGLVGWGGKVDYRSGYPHYRPTERRPFKGPTFEEVRTYHQQLLDYYRRIIEEMIRVGNAINAHYHRNSWPLDRPLKDYPDFAFSRCRYFHQRNAADFGGRDPELYVDPRAWWWDSDLPWHDLRNALQDVLDYTTTAGFWNVHVADPIIGTGEGRNVPLVPGLLIRPGTFRQDDQPHIPIKLLMHETQHNWSWRRWLRPNPGGNDLNNLTGLGHAHIHPLEQYFDRYVEFLQRTRCDGTSLWAMILQRVASERPPRPDWLR